MRECLTSIDQFLEKVSTEVEQGYPRLSPAEEEMRQRERIVIQPRLGTAGYLQNRAVNPGIRGLLDRLQVDESIGKSILQGAGSELGRGAVNLLGGAAAGGFQGLKNMLFTRPTQSRLFETLQKEDEDIGRADKKLIGEAFETMRNFAPTLATDKNAVRSFLKTVATQGGNVDYSTIRQLADAESTVNQSRSR